MNKYFTIILLLFSVSSCSKKLIGTYEHTACCMGMGCQIINLKENNRFENISWGDLMGIDTIKGIYKRDFNILVLDPILPYEYKKQTGFVRQQTSQKKGLTVVQFYSLPAILTKINDDIYDTKKYGLLERKKFQKDTLKEFTQFRINNKSYYSDTTGLITLKLNKNDTISICEILTDCKKQFSYIVKDDSLNKLDIYYPIKGFNPYYYQEVYKIKKGGLFPITDKFVTEFIVKKTDRYKCINYKERKIIRDSLFIEIQNNINRKIFAEGLYEEFYMVFNKEGRIKKVILGPEEYYSDYKITDRALSFKIRSKIKKSLKNYKIPYFDKINYNLMFRLVVDYNADNDSLILNYF
ncbi:MAG: hypothetical protein K8R49_07535 [Candidatus Cloacimonetes bacterium]|nr:hypothetical protein [Candidatus Cloacimonadota bacterium]